MTGNIFNIQRFSTSDGPGIRTTVFLKGCPLSCIWCHNPESLSSQPEIFFNSSKCINCRICEKICKHNQHSFNANNHIFLRDNCKKCMGCVLECPANAIEICGKEVTANEVIAEVLKDKEFYLQSGGGITLSGGEPLFQYDFSLEILKKAKESGIHTAIETSGYSNRDLCEINNYVDLWLYDIKLFSEEEHIKYVGVSNKKIQKNLFYLDSLGAKIILRCPIIPDINLEENHFNEIANLTKNLQNVVAIHFEPYHPLGIDKRERLGKSQKYQNKDFLSTDELLPYINRLRDMIDIEIEIP